MFVVLFFVSFCFVFFKFPFRAPPSRSSVISLRPSRLLSRHTLSNQKKKKMATNRKRESCQLLLPLLRVPLAWCSPAYWSDGERTGSACRIAASELSLCHRKVTDWIKAKPISVTQLHYVGINITIKCLITIFTV